MADKQHNSSTPEETPPSASEEASVPTPHDFHMSRAVAGRQHDKVKKWPIVGSFSQKHPRDAKGRFRHK